MRFVAILFLSLVLGANATAQQELLLSTQTDNIHAGLVNPALWPQGKKWFLGLPGLALDGWHSGKVSYSDVVKTSSGKRTINLDDVIGKLSDRNQMSIAQRTETFSLGIKFGKNLHMLAHHAIRTQTEMDYSKEMVQLFWQGNAPFIGKTVDINPKMSVSGFNELGLGASYNLGKLTIGGRYKYLNGLGILRSEKFSARVFTDPDIYQLSLNSDVSLLSAGLVTGIDTTANGFDVQWVNFDRNQFFTKNTGQSFDLGISFQATERLSISASVVDLAGSINWKNDVKRYTSNGSYTYNGVFFDGNTFLGEDGAINVDAQIDTVKQIFQFNEAAASWKQQLPARYYANLGYKATDKWQFGLGVSTTNSDLLGTVYGAGASATYQPIKWLKVGTMLSTNNNQAIQVGSLIDLRFGPGRMYVAADNVLSAVLPKSQPSVAARYGFGLVF